MKDRTGGVVIAEFIEKSIEANNLFIFGRQQY